MKVNERPWLSNDKLRPNDLETKCVVCRVFADNVCYEGRLMDFGWLCCGCLWVENERVSKL